MVRFPLVAKRDSGKKNKSFAWATQVFQSQQSANPNSEIYLQMARPCKCFTCMYEQKNNAIIENILQNSKPTHQIAWKIIVDSKLRAALGTVVVVLAAKARSISTTSGVANGGKWLG